MSLLGGERASVQNPLIKYATDAGWEYVSPEAAQTMRGGETGLVFKDTFIGQICNLNEFMTPDLCGELIKRLEKIPPNIEGNLTAWEYLKGLKQAFIPEEKRERDVKFIDDDPARNTFHVTDEFTYTNGTKTIRADIVFLVNGVPVIIGETKAAHKIDGVAEALDQMRRYHREGSEFMAMLQVYAITHIIRYYYGATWNTSRKGLYNWKEEKQGTYEELVKSFFDKNRVIKTLTDFILFTRQDDELKKVILRPHQMRSVEKVLERAADHTKKRGLVWHTQGSGKTYTMITAAKEIIDNPIFENPTVIMLVDRNELESQLFNNLTSVGFRPEDIEADSKKDLRQMLQDDKRGLIVSMIHKFHRMPENINKRDNIFILVDEAHRTTGGDLGNYLLGALPNATYIGFTGTPIDRSAHGKGTFITFGQDDPPKGYLDKYGIAESIGDGTTVELHYTLAPNDMLVDKETLEKEFLMSAEAEGISDIEELNEVLAKAVNLRNMMKNGERVGNIAEFVARHYKDYVEPMGYKAFLVAVDREACAMYKAAIDKHLPPEYSQVVFSPGANDGPELTKYHLTEEAETRIRKAFRKEELPKILIVTEKLLTGFDAPILYCMYLDKPMRDHVLLQAIARVNRPYEDEDRKKRSGFVLDFVGIFDKLEKALAFDSSDIEGVVQDLQVLRVRFSELMEKASRDYLTIIKGKDLDKAVEAVLEHFMDEEGRHSFYEFFKELSNIYEILSPDAFLRPYLDEYETLTRIYKIVKEAFDPGSLSIDKEFSRKTAKLVQEHTKSGMIKDTIPIVEINEDTINKIQGSKASDTEKVFNLIKSVLKTVEDEGSKNPYLISIGEKAAEIADMFKQRQETTQKVLEELIRLIEEINSARKEQAEKGMTPEVFSVMWLFKKEGIADPDSGANQMKEVFEAYPFFKSDTAQDREVAKRLYKVIYDAGIKGSAEMVKLGKKIMSVLTGRSRL